MFGIYVVMFLEILKTLVQVLVVFSILIIAFGLSFYILLSRDFSHLTCKRSSGKGCSNEEVGLTLSTDKNLQILKSAIDEDLIIGLKGAQFAGYKEFKLKVPTTIFRLYCPRQLYH